MRIGAAQARACGRRRDLHLKGSGRTPFARGAETEQTTRAELLASRGLVDVVDDQAFPGGSPLNVAIGLQRPVDAGDVLVAAGGGEPPQPVDRAGRVKVNPDLSIPGHPNVFVVGDMAFVEGVPGQAQGLRTPVPGVGIGGQSAGPADVAATDRGRPGRLVGVQAVGVGEATVTLTDTAGGDALVVKVTVTE